MLMRKPDLFDEIIQYLEETGTFSPTVSISSEVMDDLFSNVTPAVHPPKTAVHPQKAAVAPGKNVSGTSANPASMNWDELYAAVAGCKKCDLHSTRRNIVFEDGSRNAGLMFIGEGPGADEDAQGVPFVGRAGELLTRMINAMQFDRSEVYIANIVKCRPPNNRVPDEAEAMVCMPYLERQIELVKPEVMVLLGATPLKYITGLTGITKLRGRWLEYKGIKVMPTFHPAYLLRNPPAKAPVWQDLQEVMKVFGKKTPQPRKKA